jgi:hypothetical protein
MKTTSELVETALRNLLRSRRDREPALVDIADRDALYRAMEAR